MIKSTRNILTNSPPRPLNRAILRHFLRPERVGSQRNTKNEKDFHSQIHLLYITSCDSGKQDGQPPLKRVVRLPASRALISAMELMARQVQFQALEKAGPKGANGSFGRRCERRPRAWSSFLYRFFCTRIFQDPFFFFLLALVSAFKEAMRCNHGSRNWALSPPSPALALRMGPRHKKSHS